MSYQYGKFTTEALRTALKRWRRTNGLGGLVHFSAGDDVQSSAIRAIVEECLNVLSYGELIYGAKDEYNEFVNAERHSTFKVEEFDNLLKAVGPYLEVFNLAQWPDVDQRLFDAFEGKTFLNVKWFRLGYDECHTYRSFDITPEGISCLLKAFPNLEHLEVMVGLSTTCHYDVEDLFEAPFAETLAHLLPKLNPIWKQSL
ncbi:hypothetical protein HDU88_009027 [Geranomyces variabilis]|nr:hypothetical protein HDU88_009027 [Geranomyces variabilis]